MLGARAAMVTKVGTDSIGADTIENFKRHNVDVTHVLTTEESTSGVAPILVDDAGNNCIVVCAAANMHLTPAEASAPCGTTTPRLCPKARPAHARCFSRVASCATRGQVAAAQAVIAGANVVVCQMEIPRKATLQALRIAREAGVTTFFNPAPAVPDLEEEFFAVSAKACRARSGAGLTFGERQAAATVLPCHAVVRHTYATRGQVHAHFRACIYSCALLNVPALG